MVGTLTLRVTSAPPALARTSTGKISDEPSKRDYSLPKAVQAVDRPLGGSIRSLGVRKQINKGLWASE